MPIHDLIQTCCCCPSAAVFSNTKTDLLNIEAIALYCFNFLSFKVLF